MKLTVNTFGTQGDIQPYVALSLGLREAGHELRIVTRQIFGGFVIEHGLDFSARSGCSCASDPRIQHTIAERLNETQRKAC